MRALVAAAICSVLLAACGGNKLAGTYSNEGGSVVVDIKSGGTGSMTIDGDTRQCTYTSDQSTLKLTCGDDEVDFTIHDDGSLTGPPDSLVGELKKS